MLISPFMDRSNFRPSPAMLLGVVLGIFIIALLRAAQFIG